jgi:hypothetical protein
MRRISSKQRLLIILMAGMVALASVPARAQLLGQVTTAKTLQPGAQDIGGFLGAFDHSTTVFGQYRRGISSSLDFGLQAGLIDHDGEGSDASVIFGGDLKYNVMSTGADPFDMALDARSLFYDVGSASLFSLGGSVIISRDYRLTQGSLLTPYGGVNIRMDHVSVDNADAGLASGAMNRSSVGSLAAAGNGDNTDLNIGGVGGVKWELSDLIDAFGEVVLDDDWGLVLGLNFKL